jgi:Tfp pilus assembly protein PilF
LQKVGFRAAEATILSNIGAVYWDSNQPEKAIDYLEKSIKITLQMRGSLKQKNRKTFLEAGLTQRHYV